MSSKQKILEAVLKNQPSPLPLPEMILFDSFNLDVVNQFAAILENIGGRSFLVDSYGAIRDIVKANFDMSKYIATNIPDLSDIATLTSPDSDPHNFNDIELMLVKGHFGVAENSAVWITERLMGQRVSPFICQHLAVIINATDIVPTMHHAYDRIGNEEYRFGTFIAGPSKTADIEQALVLGAHGPRTMTIFILSA